MKVIRKDGPGKKLLDNAVKNLGKNKGKVGWFESSKYPDGTQVAYVAAIQEFGYAAGNIPPRSFMRTTQAEKQTEWLDKSKILAAKVLKGSLTDKQAMETLVLKAAGDVRKKIASIQSPALKQSTIDARKRARVNKKVQGKLDKPLVDNRYLISTLDGIVEDK